MARPPTVCVVIPSYRRLERLPGLVETYLDQDADEVVVVLDGPHDGWQRVLARAVAHPRVQVVELPVNRGLALARIAGLEVAGADVVVMTDDDVVPQPGFVQRHRSFHDHHDQSVLLGYMPVALPARRGPDQAPTYLYAKDYEKQVANWRTGDSDALLGSLWGGNVSLPRDLYLRAERLKPSERLNYNEDLDLGMRLRGLGAGAVFDEHAKALHHHHRDLAGFMNECVVRGEAIHDLERRWGSVPGQLTPLIQIPPHYHRLAARLQRRVGARDSPGAIEHGLAMLYRALGHLRAWGAQEAVSRLLRRGLAIRGYRTAGVSDPKGREAHTPAT